MNVDKTKGMQLLFGKKSSVSKVDTCGVCSDLVVSILFSVQNVRGGFIVVVLMCLGRSLYYRVGMSLSAVLFYVYVVGHNCSVEEKLEFKICDDVLEEVGKFCYLGYMIMVEHLGSKCKNWKGMEEVQGVKCCVITWEARFIFDITGEDLLVLC